ncbi:MAG: tRNA pseudouridine(55) synthase TruB [Bacteroidales bacterium]|jgi:tRNA pseudouridine55 synthase
MSPFDFEKGEVILIDKPYDWTSFDVVNKIRCLIKYHLGIKKIKMGHAGTLDPLATGLLILCSGNFTKKIDEFQGKEKEYIGIITLGATRPSSDMETEIDKTYDINGICEEDIFNIAKTYIGDIKQIPPLFSAKKIEGERAYEFARKGIEKQMEPKDVTISEFEITHIKLPEVGFRVVCSKGTYIRSLARDFGEKLNNGAYLSELRRTRIGEFHIGQSNTLEEIEQKIMQQ